MRAFANAILSERSSVVAWLRQMGKAQELIDPGLPEMLNAYADLIAHGEHIRVASAAAASSPDR